MVSAQPASAPVHIPVPQASSSTSPVGRSAATIPAIRRPAAVTSPNAARS